MSTLCLLATDGSVEMNTKIARAYSALVRDFLDIHGDDEVAEIPVPFDRAMCRLVVDVWHGRHMIHVQNATRADVARMCRALDCADYLQFDDPSKTLVRQLRDALSPLPLPPAPPRPRPIRGPSVLPPDDAFPASHDPRLRRAWQQQNWGIVEALVLAGRGCAEIWRLYTMGSAPKKTANLISAKCSGRYRPNWRTESQSCWLTEDFDEVMRSLGGDANDFFQYEERIGLTLYQIETLARHVATFVTRMDPLILTWLIRTAACDLSCTVNPVVARLVCEMEGGRGPFAERCAGRTTSDEVLACVAEFIERKEENVIANRILGGSVEDAGAVRRLLSLGFNTPSVYMLVDYVHDNRYEQTKPIILELLQAVEIPSSHRFTYQPPNGSQWFVWFEETRRSVFETRKIKDSGVDEGSAKRAIAALVGL